MRATLVIVCAMILLGAAQGALAHRMTIGQISPDFLIAATAAIGLLLGPTAGTLAGMLAGLAHGSITGVGLGSFMASRALVGCLAGSAKSHVFHDNPLVPLVGGIVGTLVAESVFVLLNPPARLGEWFAPLPLIAIYNGIIAVPTYWVLRRLLISKAALPRGPYVRPGGELRGDG